MEGAEVNRSRKQPCVSWQIPSNLWMCISILRVSLLSRTSILPRFPRKLLEGTVITIGAGRERNDVASATRWDTDSCGCNMTNARIRTAPLGWSLFWVCDLRLYPKAAFGSVGPKRMSTFLACSWAMADFFTLLFVRIIYYLLKKIVYIFKPFVCSIKWVSRVLATSWMPFLIR